MTRYEKQLQAAYTKGFLAGVGSGVKNMNYTRRDFIDQYWKGYAEGQKHSRMLTR